MTQEALVLKLTSGFDHGLEPDIDRDTVVVKLAPAKLVEFARYVRDQLGFDMLTSITAVDNGESFELLYHWISVKPLSQHTIQPTYPGYLQARVTVPKSLGADTENPGPDYEPLVPSITATYPGANQQEREIYDLMGIRFKGHPRLERILLWEGFPGHPLRKDWRPLNAEIPWHLAGLTGFGGGGLRDAPAVARVAEDGGEFSQPIPLGTTPESFNHPASRPPKPTEKMRIKLGQGGIVDDESPAGPRSGYGAAAELGGGETEPAGAAENPEDTK